MGESKIRRIVRKIPLLNFAARKIYRAIVGEYVFPGSKDYWESLYSTGGTSGPGSYGILAEFVTDVLNSFVKEHEVSSVIELGCGDGNRLLLANYPSYIGLDVSRSAVKLCKKKFEGDGSKSFFLYDPECFVDKHSVFKAELSLSLDVIYHIVEDNIFDLYMKHLFSVSQRFVIIYSSDMEQESNSPHVKYRYFSKWISSNLPEWRLIERIPNKYPFEGDSTTGSLSDFFIYEKETGKGEN